MSQITVGKTIEGHNLTIDLVKLAQSRLLLTADSGGGKTFAIKEIVEQAYGTIQIIIIDPEGEFAPLRTHYSFILATRGEGAEASIEPRGAALLAERLLEIHANAICDLSELKPSERQEWVAKFLTALIEAPKELRHPCLVIVDEAHIFAPEQSGSISLEAMNDLCTRGRKRGLIAVFATQALASLSKTSSGMLRNRLIGPTFEDVNLKRAADILGVGPKDDYREWKHQMRTMEAGHFWAVGIAICKTPTLIKVNKIKTPHGDDALKYIKAPPPLPANYKKLLPQLADLPKQAEAKAKTEAELRTQIRSLETQLRTRPAETREVKVVDPVAIERAVTASAKQYLASLANHVKSFREIGRLVDQVSTITQRMSAEQPPALAHSSFVGKVQIFKSSVVTNGPSRDSVQKREIAQTRTTADSDLAPGEKAILIAVAQYDDGATKDQLCVLAGYKKSSRDVYIGKLRSKNYVTENGGRVLATSDGIVALGNDYQPLPTGRELREYWLSKLPAGEKRILSFLIDSNDAAVDRDALDEPTGYKKSSRDVYIGRLVARRLVETVGRGEVRASPNLF